MGEDQEPTQLVSQSWSGCDRLEGGVWSFCRPRDAVLSFEELCWRVV